MEARRRRIGARACAALLLLVAACTAAALAARDEPQAEVCAPPFAPLPSGSCVALPHDASADTQVIVFLHGMAPTRDAIVRASVPFAEAANAAGMALIVPFGARGYCPWSADAREWLCWPNSPGLRSARHTVVQRLEEDVRAVGRMLSARAPVVPVLVGFSNGAFAAARLTAENALPVRAVGIAHGGVSMPAHFGADAQVPVLLLAARGDRWHYPTMQELRDELLADGWSPTWSERDGAHELTGDDVRAIVDFLGALAPGDRVDAALP